MFFCELLYILSFVCFGGGEVISLASKTSIWLVWMLNAELLSPKKTPKKKKTFCQKSFCQCRICFIAFLRHLFRWWVLGEKFSERGGIQSSSSLWSLELQLNRKVSFHTYISVHMYITLMYVLSTYNMSHVVVVVLLACRYISYICMYIRICTKFKINPAKNLSH